MHPKNRRKTILQPQALLNLWQSVNADICTTFNDDKASRNGYIVNSHVNFEKVADKIELILKTLLKTLEKSFPDVFVTTPLEIGYRPARRLHVPPKSKSPPHRSKTETRSTTRQTPTTLEAASKWSCMGYARTIDEWNYEPLTGPSKQMNLLLGQLERCSIFSEEKFLVMPYTWKLVSKGGKNINHYSCIVVDLEPKNVVNRDIRDIHVYIVDVNGQGDSSSAYKRVFKEPQIGLNPLIKIMVKSVFVFVAKVLGFRRLVVDFPSFLGINVLKESAIAAVERDQSLFPGTSMLNPKMELGVCSIATLFMIIRLACDQRKVFKEGVDVTLRRFTKSTQSTKADYPHVLFIRAFVYSLLEFLKLDTKQYGISGHPYHIRKEEGGNWTIRPHPKRLEH